MTATHTDTHKPNPKSREHRDDLVRRLEADLTEICSEEFAHAIPHSPVDLARRLADRLRERWGSEERYIPASDTATRDRGIRRMFNGRNMLEVCNKYNVSPATVYRCCGRKLPWAA